MDSKEINSVVSKLMGRAADWFHDTSLLNELTLKAANRIHGSVSLYIDGDNFDPPPCYCVINWWLMQEAKGEGATMNEAVCRALILAEGQDHASSTRH